MTHDDWLLLCAPDDGVRHSIMRPWRHLDHIYATDGASLFRATASHHPKAPLADGDGV